MSSSLEGFYVCSQVVSTLSASSTQTNSPPGPEYIVHVGMFLITSHEPYEVSFASQAACLEIILNPCVLTSPAASARFITSTMVQGIGTSPAPPASTLLPPT